MSLIPEVPKQHVEHDSLKALRYRNEILKRFGFYTADELIDLAESVGFTVFDPFTRIRKGTVIGKDVVISEGCAIEGNNIVIGERSKLSYTVLRGSNLHFGVNNLINGSIDLPNITFGDDNIIHLITGENNGIVRIGNNNQIGNIKIDNKGGGDILIGNNNELNDKLNINIPFKRGWILIGNNNSLGRDGGGVVSSSYRYGRGWGGPLIIGNNVESTRGAEILGFSILGIPPTFSQSVNLTEETLADYFANRSLFKVEDLLLRIKDNQIDDLFSKTPSSEKVSLYGVVKVKRCCLIGKIKIKDDTRVQCAYIRDLLIPERCNIKYSQIIPNKQLTVPLQNSMIEHKIVTNIDDLECLPNASLTEEYPADDLDFYNNVLL